MTSRIKLSEKRKITQTEKRQRYFVYDHSKRNQGMGEGVCMACLRRRKECNVLAKHCIIFFCSSCHGRGQDTSTIEIQGKNAFRDRKAGLVKPLAD